MCSSNFKKKQVQKEQGLKKQKVPFLKCVTHEDQKIILIQVIPVAGSMTPMLWTMDMLASQMRQGGRPRS